MSQAARALTGAAYVEQQRQETMRDAHAVDVDRHLYQPRGAHAGA